MPIPKPGGGESEQDYVSRCMEKLADDFPDQQQRAAVCYRQYREAQAMPKITAQDDDDDDDRDERRRRARDKEDDDEGDGGKRRRDDDDDDDDDDDEREDRRPRRGKERESAPGNGYSARHPRPWFQMKAAKADGPAEIMIYDEIGPGMFGGGLSAKDFHKELNGLGKVKEIVLRINSPGGNVFDALAIHNMLKAHPARITAKIDGIAASAASLIAMAGDKITMPKNGFFMLHKPQAMVMGDVDDMKAMASDLQRMTKVFAQCYSARSGGKKSPRDMVTLMAESRLMDAAEAHAFGLTDEIADPVKMTACFDIRKLPTKAAQARIKAEFTVATGWGVPRDEDEEQVVETGSPNPFDDNGLMPVDENGLMVPAQKPGHGVEESYETGFNTPPFNDLGSEPEDMDTESSSLGRPKKTKRSAKMKAQDDDLYGDGSPGDSSKATKKLSKDDYGDEKEEEEDDDLYGEGAVSTEKASKASRKAVEALRVAAGIRAYGSKEMKETMELCALAGASAKVANEFIANKTPVADVRRALMDRRVLKDAETRILGRQPAFDAERSEKAALDSWQKAISDVNARVAMPEVGKTLVDRN